MKRIFDILISIIGIIIFFPILVIFSFLVWMQDFCSPFYVAERIGKNMVPFPMVKIRSMVKGADASGVSSTGVNDNRITRIGHIIRRYKIDELPQLVNVILGHMSIVGPRPNVRCEVDKYSDEENELLSVRPGITDFASIVYSDEGEILKDSLDPDLTYDQFIRPNKSMLSLIYIEKRNFYIDLYIISLTVLNVFSRRLALAQLRVLLKKIEAPLSLINF